MSLQKRSKRAVSLVERFTEEEIKLHIMSLKKPSTQSAVEGMCDLKEEEESCQLCDDGTLLFPPQPLYCLLCSRRIDDRSFYYTPGEEELSNAQHQICSPCHSRCKTKFPLCGVFIDKHKMLKRSNFDNADTEEVNFITLSISLSFLISHFMNLTNYISYFCWSSGFNVNLVKNGNIRYVVSTISLKTKTKPQSIFVLHVY